LRILLLTRYGRLGASSRLRAIQYLPYLRSQGFEITEAPLFADWYQENLYDRRPPPWGRIAGAYLRRAIQLIRAKSFDLVWIEYETFPWLPAVAERILSAMRIPYIVDYDDAIYHRYDLHRRRIIRSILGTKIDEVMRRAAVVVVGNKYLGARALAAGATRVEYLPTVVDLARYPKTDVRDRTPLTIGWIGSQWTAKYLSLVEPVIRNFCRDGQARLILVGVRESPFDHMAVEVRPWSEATEVSELQDFDIGIMPLPDGPWERGKCGYKLIQYMAAARPVIASPVGLNSEIVETGINGFLASTPFEWRSALETLWGSVAIRSRLGDAGRQKVEAHYCTRVTSPRLADILRRAIYKAGCV